MISVIVRCYPLTQFRAHLAAAVIERLLLWGPEIDLQRIRHVDSLPVPFEPVPGLPGAHVLGGDDFWRSSRILADDIARSDEYVLLDDDHLPIGSSWAFDGVAALRANPDFVSLSSWSINEEVRATGEGPIFEAASTGTPCFVRKGTFVGLPSGAAPDYDITLSRWLLERGRIGFLRDVRHNHLGCEFSQVIPEHWRA